ncbi:D-tyrosyl-tRNA(Tyr) deacylase [candidate division FCPU426 bacterium]|nr:D-tyrosyl-tRNA(Tyr) deacylase [candidate division FCPU426 bacterium]
MMAVVQRVLHASVQVNNMPVAEIAQGLLVLLGVAHGDEAADAEYLAGKIAGLRVFADPSGKMNLSVQDVGGEILAVPQFTLLGDCRRGRRPDFTQAAPPREGLEKYEWFCQCLQKQKVRVLQGRFQEHMQVHLLNDGPVTLILESKKS